MALRLPHVAAATQALFLILLLTTPNFVLGGGGGKGGGGGNKKGRGGGGKRPVSRGCRGAKKPNAPHSPAVKGQPQGKPPASGGTKKPNAPYSPAVKGEPPAQAKPLHTAGGGKPPAAPANNIKLPGPGTGPTSPAGPASKGKGEGITHKGGPLMTGELNLSIIFYGQFTREHKDLLRSFLRSFEVTDPGTAVSKWWDIVDSYQGLTKNPSPNTKGVQGIKVKVGTQQSDDKCEHGKVLTKDFIKLLVKKANSGKPNTLAVIFVAKDVAVSELCRGKCYDHGEFDKFPYLIVGNPEIECPGSCAWPFVKNDYGPPGVVVKPPNGDAGIDAMIMNFASGLASAVTNPFNDGFQKPGPKTWPIEAGNACEGIFGSGAVPGQTGKIMTDPAGGAYNAVGENGLKFLIPGVWDPKTSTCWTPM